jgi:hypothetical protein
MMNKICEVCGNDYAKAFEVIVGGESHVFDSFECAIQLLAPMCDDCGCRIIGHGVESGELTYCGAHCASRSGDAGAVDHLPARRSAR